MLEKILDKVQKPSRYTGGEFCSVVKNPKDADVRFAFCFPDLYEVGMSHLGMKILYHMLNERDDIYCERAFMPWVDMVSEMESHGLPLFALESRDPLSEFDILGFTLQYEMSYTNVLAMLSLAHIPLRSADRCEDMPLVCAGGPCAFNPEPLADFIDFFVIGEGEDVTLEVIDKYKECKRRKASKHETLMELSKIQGVYVPSFYEILYDGDVIKSITPKYPGVSQRVRKRIVKNMDSAFYPEKLIVPYSEIVHDRIMLELFRGCIRGCRFCQAGIIYRPVRERSPKRLIELSKKLMENTGYEEISLSSLSTSDYSNLPGFTRELIELTEREMTSLSLPSLRIDNFSMELMQRVQKVRKSALTFAPEAGTQRMRDIINKGITEEDILNSARTAFSGGYQSIKLYFMIGLPYETLKDVEGIPELAQKILDVYFEEPREKGSRGVSITISVSSFVPKPHTPFQWAAQDSRELLREKQRVLCDSIRSRKIKLNYHDSELSVLEGVFARGDRRLCAVLERAVNNGCRFDGWTEQFRYDAWLKSFEECGISPESYTRERGYDEILPWDIIDTGVTKKFLINENEKAKRGELTENCRHKCAGCGAAQFEEGVCFE